MQILNSLLPILAVILLGGVLRRQGFLTEEITRGFNALAYFWALPLFLFYKLASASTRSEHADEFTITLLIATIATLIASWLVAYWRQMPYGSRGAFMQASFRGNLAFIGLPLILFSLESVPPELSDQLESAVLIAFAPNVIFYNAAAVAVLTIYNYQTSERFCWKQVGWAILSNPILIACVAGLVVQTSGWGLTHSLERTCAVVGAAAFPLALLGIGSQMASLQFSGRWSDPILSSVLKCVFCPVVGWLVGRLLGLSGIELQVILILCAVPTAVSSYVLVDQMNGDSDLAAGSVVVGTVFSLLPLSILLAWPM